MKIYLVGGAVRDQLLGRPIRERDWVVVGATPQEMKRRGFHAKDPEFPVFLHPDTGEEYALARRESKSAPGHKGFNFDCSANITLEEDLARRDLTINAIAQSDNGDIFDPFHGSADIQSRCLRNVTEAFVEDPLRVLRLARFQAELGEFQFTIAEQTDALASQMCAGGELRTLSSGRIWRETERALAAATPTAFFSALIRWEALSQLMPWLNTNPEYDLKESMAALTRSCEQSKDPDTRLATLVLSTNLKGGTAVDFPGNWPISATARALAKLCSEHPVPGLATPETILNWLQAVDAWRRGTRFGKLLQLWLAAEPDLSASLNRLRQCRDVSRQVPPPEQGSNARAMVRAYRLQKISEALQQAPLQ